ncbi:hypothetical protein Tco_0819649 [Tanacetum coccineum]|uniref:Uncharacterized protein n=1 Tax=Tanacetum coccineum TaxID=301880 RepID=A0ABQ5A766_9ASTR
MVEFLGTIPINLKGNMWESEETLDNKIDWSKPPKRGDGAWHIRIELIDPDGEKFDRAFQSIPTTRKLSAKENPSRKAYLLEDKQILSVGVFDEVSFYTLFQALGWHLEEIHVTWTQFGKKQDKITTLHKKAQKIAYNVWRRRRSSLRRRQDAQETASEEIRDDVWINRLKQALEYSAGRRRRNLQTTPSRLITWVLP